MKNPIPLLALLMLFSAPLAHGNGTPAPTPTGDPNATATATATSSSTSAGGHATGGNATATGGAGGAGGAGGSSDAEGGAANSDAEGGKAILSNQYKQVRQAPMAYAPPAFPAIGCGRGLALGGSSPVGGATVAFNWSNKECEAFAAHVSLAQSFSAIGRNELSCGVLLHLPLAKEIFPELPTCEVAPSAAGTGKAEASVMPSAEASALATAAPPASSSPGMTREEVRAEIGMFIEEVNQKVDRAFKQSSQK